jgi:hypothetical protein
MKDGVGCRLGLSRGAVTGVCVSWLCHGKLVVLDVLLRRLKTGGHRVLVFTQVLVCLGGAVT